MKQKKLLYFTSLLFFLSSCASKESFTHSEKSNWIFEIDRNTKKIIWYKITQPVRNAGKGWLYIKVETENPEEENKEFELNVNQLALASTLLESNSAFFNDSTNNIIVTKDLMSKNDTVIIKKDTTAKKPF